MLSEDYEQAQYLSSQVEQARQRAVLAASDAGSSRDGAHAAEQVAREHAKDAERVVQGAEKARDEAQAAADRAEAPTDLAMANLANNPASEFSNALDGVLVEKMPPAIHEVMGPAVGGLVAQAIAADNTVANAAAAAVDANPKINQIEANAEGLRGEVLGAYATASDAENMGLRPAISTIYAIPFTDRNGAAAGGVRTDGTFNFEKPLEVMGAGGVVFQPVTAPGWAELHPDKDGYISYGVRDDGTFVVFKPAPEISYDPLRAANDTLGYTKTARDKICTIGDSLTEGHFGGVGGQTADAWPTKLKNLLGAGVTVTNLAVSGYAVDEEAIRVGALQVPLTVAGGQIPASGTVEVTTTTVIGWVPSAARNFTGTLAGVPGTLRRTSASNTVFEFIRTTDGAAVTVPPGTKFVSNAAGHDGQILIILLGRNDVSNNIKGAEATVAEHIIKGVERIVNWQSRQVKKVLVVSVTNGQNEPSSHANYKTIATANAGLANLMGPRFLDFRTRLVKDAIYAAGITPTSADLAAMANDAPPASVMDDNIHWSKQTHTYFAGLAHEYLTTRDWTA